MLSSRRGAPAIGGGDEEDPTSTADASSASAEEPKTHPPATLTACLASYSRSLLSRSTIPPSFSSHCLAISLFVAFLFSLLALSLLLRFTRPLPCIPPYDPLARSVHFTRRLEGLASDFGSLGVPWCRSKQGRSVDWTPADLIKALEEFVPIYETRPIQNNMYGMGFDHSFGLWFMARWLKPDLMIESGAFKGHSTWVLRQARPEVKIISLSPRHPEKYLKKGPAYVDPNCTYFAGKNFVDFGSVEWRKVLMQHGVKDFSKVLVFFDDHQNELKRLKQALKAGFRHLIFEDNYDTGTGDHYSLRQICDQSYVRGGGHSCFRDGDEARIRSKRKKFWDKALEIDELCGKKEAWWGVRGYMRDDFNHSNKAISYAEHFQNSRFVESVLNVYWELPPVAGPSLTHQTRYDPARATDPIVEDGRYALFQRLGLGKLDSSVFNGYTQMVYVEISP
ncbi:DNA-directed RNA polymerase subunit beta [Rhynchospora pubera]|uniref:DNA-directed RNA polymerase subunit beta n=1 Tax=Rhynchospora pubera TaxID=906938 RepID=A0AAV8AKR4_9POAL|nr:DNA-directed RNA polymerase subunit beta [Rhynchospora pubera]KAJ4731013.1 DNA-directed RNA polymerase subunit beta [Rhynchospora pubera]KAJ4771124.1 DNA-directed RNA polymerase subunit beta [Rhynchospora pubera]